MKALFEHEIVTRKGKPVSVIIPIKDYAELLERVEDADDVAALKRARRKPLHYRPLEDATRPKSDSIAERAKRGDVKKFDCVMAKIRAVKPAVNDCK